MKTKRISCESARSICIVKTLERLGHFPSRISEKEAWFLSPLRSETHASFKVSLPLNRWYDFGIGRGGNVIDLVCLVSNCSVIDALSYLSDELPVLSNYGKYEFRERKTKPKNIVLRVKTIEHPLLKKYLISRKISISVAKIYCREIWFECNGRIFFAVGLENHLLGWELRNLYSKSSTSPKSYSYRKKDKQHLVVLEGMFDLLSLAIISPEEVENSDLLILNSLSFIPQVLPLLENYVTISLYLDRDFSGLEATGNLLRSSPKIIDRSSIYTGFKDLNEKLLNTK
ncbi:toprim domain-containing protein [Antarcticibacterium sp. 1MA-6-2]|uniref:toprim domain-containing protein n=1 Tax=Antarcticibacterium sp. 1MA-6-2 TaxID=2908210 RepID=UPI001F32DFE5|nr:toprim domain-containing protein [Antarcticibacterium sp. 1MA-6-2]UJH90551.1 toprim domain-containing protein [Antarcticibacterium sp. 1MA-6-2]